MGKLTRTFLLCGCFLILITGCALFGKNSEKQAGSAGEEVKVEVDRKVISEGMDIDAVKGVLGDTDNLLVNRRGRSVLIYDRVSAIDVKRDRDTLVLIGLTPDADATDGTKKFTITIIFDSERQVDDFDFGPSRF